MAKMTVSSPSLSAAARAAQSRALGNVERVSTRVGRFGRNHHASRLRTRRAQGAEAFRQIRVSFVHGVT